MPDSSTFLKLVEKSYQNCQRFIINFQNPITGLIPSSLYKGRLEPAPNCNFAWVRDNVYSAMSIWALSIAYRKISERKDVLQRANELEYATVKLMRSILYCMMLQAKKVEQFKTNQSLTSCLHAKYSIETCETVVGDNDWGHLQLDATSLYLLMLAQMISSGVNIIYTSDEVAFIQNLVFYIETSYRVPDYGIFERGDKTNHGLPELNGSSIGMAKAALQALSEFNLFGSKGGPSSVIHVQLDNIIKCQAVVESMLPKESLSKEVAASLLSVISFPAFATENIEMVNETRSLIKSKLEGRYGFCRFIRDGYKAALEDPSRLHYEVYELKVFENIESEWPLFFIYLIIDGIFCDDRRQADEYMSKLKKIIILDEKDFEMIPELYYVPRESVDAEYKDPKSQDRLPGDHLPHLWSQSLYIVASLLYDNIITPGDIDPINRRYYSRSKPDLVIQVLLVAQDDEAYKILSHENLAAHHNESDASLSVLPASFLNNIYEHLGQSSSLKLSGRPQRDVGTVSTSILYRSQDRFYVFNPQFMDTSLFYFTYDHNLLVDNFRNEMDYLRANWKLEGRPTIVLSVSSFLLGGSMNSVIGNFISTLNTGHFYGIRVRLGTLSDFIATSCITRWDFLNSVKVHDLLDNLCHIVRKRNRRSVSVFDRSATKLDYSPSNDTSKSKFDHRMRQSTILSQKLITSKSTMDDSQETSEKLFTFKPHTFSQTISEQLEQQLSSKQYLEILETADDIYEQALCLFELYKSEGMDFEIVLKNGINYGTVRNLMRDLYSIAGSHELWILARQTAGYLKKYADGLSQAGTDLIVRQKQFSVGYSDYKEHIVTLPLSPEELTNLIYECYGNDLTAAVLTQEIMVYLAMFIRTEPHLFDQMLRLRLGLIIEVAATEFIREANLSPAQGADSFLNLSPFTMKSLIHHIVSGKEFRLSKTNNQYTIVENGSRISSLKFASTSIDGSTTDPFDSQTNITDTSDSSSEKIGFWYRRRCIDGSLNRIPDGFFSNIWLVLNACNGISFCGHVLPSVIIQEMTPNEMKFALRVESALNAINRPAYRQVMIEAIMFYGDFLRMYSHNTLITYILQIDRLVGEANELFLQNQMDVHGDAVSCCAGRPKNLRECFKFNQVCKFFLDIAPSGEFGSMNFLAKAFLHTICELNEPIE